MVEHRSLFEGVIAPSTAFAMGYTKTVFQISQDPHLSNNITISREVRIRDELDNETRAYKFIRMNCGETILEVLT